MRRIIITGTTGAGKSTLARQLAQKLELAHVELDELFHLPGWEERPDAEFRAQVETATRQDSWVVAGNYYSKVRDILWTRADTVIWLDLPFGFNFRQLLKRTFKRLRTGELICNGNRESLGKSFFSSKSILWWFLKTWRKNRKAIGGIFAQPGDYPHVRFIRLESRQQIYDFVAGVKPAK